MELITADGFVLHATSVNVSLHGLMVETDRLSAKQVSANSKSSSRGNPVIDVHLTLPVMNESPELIQLLCEVINSIRLAENIYQINLEYRDPDQASLRSIETFALENMKV